MNIICCMAHARARAHTLMLARWHSGRTFGVFISFGMHMMPGPDAAAETHKTGARCLTPGYSFSAYASPFLLWLGDLSLPTLLRSCFGYHVDIYDGPWQGQPESAGHAFSVSQPGWQCSTFAIHARVCACCSLVSCLCLLRATCSVLVSHAPTHPRTHKNTTSAIYSCGLACCEGANPGCQIKRCFGR